MLAPFFVAVRLVPNLVIADASLVPFGHGRRKIHKISVIIGRGKIACHIRRLRPAPRRRLVQPRRYLDAVLVGQLHNVVVFQPRIHPRRVVAPVHKIPLAMDFNIGPHKRLANHGKARFFDEAQALVAHFGQCFLLQKGVDAKGGQRTGGEGMGGKGGLRPNTPIHPLRNPAQLGEQFLLPR